MNVNVMCVQRKCYPKNLFYLKNLYLHFSSPFSQESGGEGATSLGVYAAAFPPPETYRIIEKP